MGSEMCIRDRLCRFCEESDETFYHLWAECPVYNEQARLRQELLLKDGKDPSEWNPKELLKFANKDEIKTALTYDPTQA